MAMIIEREGAVKRNIERGDIVSLNGTSGLGIVYQREEVSRGEYAYHVLWFDSNSSYSVYDSTQIELFNGSVTIKN